MIGAFFAWWIGQLGELLPSWLRRPALTRMDALVVAPIGSLDRANTIAAALRRGGRETRLGIFPLAAAELSDLPRSPKRPTVLRLDRADVLEKVLNLPLAAEAELDQVLTFEMDRETPFSADDVYWNYTVEAADRQQGRLSVRLSLIPRSSLSTLLRALDEADIAPKWVEVAHAAEEASVLPLDGAHNDPAHGSRRLVLAAGICCALLAAGAVATPFARQMAELAALDREVAAGQKVAAEADELRREIDRLLRGSDLVRSAQEKTGRPMAVLASVTALLPDDTYLTELELRQRKLTLGGRSASAARLIGAFAGDPLFRNPGFAAPVTRIESLRTEVFSIVAEVGAAP